MYSVVEACNTCSISVTVRGISFVLHIIANDLETTITVQWLPAYLNPGGALSNELGLS